MSGFAPAGFLPAGFLPPGFFPNTGEVTPPVLFELELVDFLAGKLSTPCHPGIVPEGVADWPLLTWNVIDGAGVTALAGPAGLASVRVQLDAWSTSVADTSLLSRRLFDLLAGYRGRVGRATVQGAFRVRQMGGFTPYGNGSAEGLYRNLSEWTFWWEEPRPVR